MSRQAVRTTPAARPAPRAFAREASAAKTIPDPRDRKRLAPTRRDRRISSARPGEASARAAAGAFLPVVR
jgi:hypothetical protein